MTLKLAIWDMDGTLVDSRQVIQDAMTKGFVDCGMAPPAYEETRQIVGLSLYDGCKILAPDDTPEPLLLSLVDAYKNAFVANRIDPNFREPLYDGALESLEALRKDDWLIAMATGKSHRGIAAIFEHHPDLKPYFDTIWCADDGPGKPNPYMVEQAMGALGAESSQSLMIGDATFDMLMGRAAGVRSLGVSWGFGKAEELTRAGANEVHHDFATLDASFRGFANGGESEVPANTR